MHRGRQQQLSPCRRETWLEIGGKEVPRKWRYRLRGGRAFGSVKIASQICVEMVEMVGFLVSITFFPPQKKHLQTKRSRAFDQSKMDYTFQVVGRKKTFKRRIYVGTILPKRAPKKLTWNQKNWWCWVDVSGFYWMCLYWKVKHKKKDLPTIYKSGPGDSK